MTAPQKILIVTFDNIGDVVMTTGIIRPLKNIFPDTDISYFTKDYAAPILANHPLLHRVHTADPFWDKSPGRPSGSMAAFYKAWKEVKRESYTAAVILNSEWRRAMAIRLAGIPDRIGANRRKSAIFLTHAVAEDPALLHFSDRHRRLIEEMWPATDSESDWRPHLPLSAADREVAQQFRNEAGWPSEKIIAIHSSSGDPLKNWPIENWRELVNRLHRRRPDVRFLAIGSLPEAPLIGQIFGELPKNHWRISGGDLGKLKGLLSASSLLIGMDSGPGHVAAGVGIPVLSLFGPTDPARSAARGASIVRVIRRDPIVEIRVEEVEAEAFSIF